MIFPNTVVVISLHRRFITKEKEMDRLEADREPEESLSKKHSGTL
jgi:hypothetical protein